MTLWDKNYKDSKDLENWLYGNQSLNGFTRFWFISEARNWPMNTKLLDAGCGGGVTAYQLEKFRLLNKIRYTGVDFSQCMLDLADRKVKHDNIYWKKSSIDMMGFKNSFDKVLLRAVLAHVLDPEPVIKSAIKALRPGGVLYIIFWNNPVRGDPLIKRIDGDFYDNAHSEEKLRRILKVEGMRSVQEKSIPEKSARSNYRTIWVEKKSKK